jgi:glutathione peroxidase
LGTDSVRGKAVLVVNVASHCGFTPQYDALEKLHQRYKDRGFTVLGVPCNQFGEQEPGSADEIATFCSTTYGVSFPLTEKLDVNGAHRHPLFQLLTAARDAEGRAGDVEWNFEKFLVSPKGEVVARFRSMVAPDADEVVSAVETVLQAEEVETTWVPAQAEEVRPGDRVRLGSGAEMTVSRVESPFLGQDTLVCLIEDSPERWLAQPVPKTSQVDLARPTS